MLTTIPLPAEDVENDPEGVPDNDTVSEPITPDKDAVPERIALVVPSYTLVETFNPDR